MLIPYVVQMVTTANGEVHDNTPAEWRCRARLGNPSVHGKPNEKNLATHVARFEASTQKGGCNEHLGVTVVISALIKDQRTGATVAAYKRSTAV